MDLTINAEVALLSLFLFNILCGIYAIRFPRTSSLPGTPLAKPPVAKENSITPKRDYNILPPRVNTTFHSLKRMPI